jgi:putative effector of murein hydrolase LrgA (UPF0299 family)
VLPGLALCTALARGGEALVAALDLPFAGPVLGLLAYALWLMHGRGVGWSRPGALLLARWLGLLLVPILVGLTAHGAILAAAWAPLLVLMIVTTLATALATALIHRWLTRP